ncbi:CDGSH iron-sulfur domain-containing protein [Govanella unica]|uniref:CDGSH iron-sulfur domain-containing protein n=1 Tax=Govanella unica TaxID=2975056 RepID=A0A9X3TZC4_9PROT|nr:CDGSH iron-sulfur domain-containing protein [Govania unica]MDA5194549.1 CDGSH iron-sulfur domain-containing protein [Govania unica]
MNAPVVAKTKPFYKELKKGRSYLWCSCGQSKRQPFCDYSHVGTAFEPVTYVGQYDGEEVLFCGCKQTGTGPFCDGAHNNILGGYRDDDPNSPENLLIPLVTEMDAARKMLDGGCYVFSTTDADYQSEGNLRHTVVISEAQGAQYQSQFYAELESGLSPVMSFGDRHVVLLISEGSGQVVIGGQSFDVNATDGIYVRPGESFVIQSADAALKTFISACPAAPEMMFTEQPSSTFEADWPQRVISVDPEKRHSMAARFFQMLVDKTIGSTVATQFIGHIPFSKAEPHRHLYEESLIVLTGKGCFWTDSLKTNVKAGDVIFLPRKVRHSFEATDEHGMDVAGVIYPGDNPSINY